MREIIASILLFLMCHRLWVAIFVGAYVLTSVILLETGFGEISIKMMMVLLVAIAVPYFSFSIFSILGGVA